MNDLVRQLATDSGVLRHVSGRRSPAGYELLELGFDRGTLRPTCDADTDEIVVEAIGQEASEVGEIPDDGALASLLGKAIEQAWTMVNDRGYKDAFQIRCLDLATRSQSCVQFCNHSCSRQRLIARSCLQTQRPRPSIHRGWYTRCCTASGSPNPPDPIRDIQPTPAGQSIALRCSNMPGVLRISDEVVYRGIERHDRAFANSREYRSSERVPLGLLGGFAPDECVPWPSPTRPNPPYPQNQPFPTGVPALLLNGDLDVVSLEDAKAALPLFPSGTPFVQVASAGRITGLWNDCAQGIVLHFIDTFQTGDTSCASDPTTPMHQPFGAATGTLQLQGVGRFPRHAQRAIPALVDPGGSDNTTPDRRLGVDERGARPGARRSRRRQGDGDAKARLPDRGGPAGADGRRIRNVGRPTDLST